ncbi:MAG: protein kinase [Acidobacteria bacterium]|nr:protein kinase [Acidobacteriota bacterium]
MNPERYQKIKRLFNESVELGTAERGDFLASVCDDSEMRRELEKMLALAADETADPLEKNAFERFAGEAPKTPERIGDYRILRELGRGGMGAVYEAVRETSDFRQRVALKVIKRGMDTDAVLSRFRHEQKILASLEHPSIARFLDGGMTADGRPYLVMEFVEGAAIDDYCAAQHLSLDDRLKLFREVCAAVQYAHQNLVVHRDLKPKNILVTPGGAPKLLDFGIGKILTPETEDEIGTATALGMMTPAYASPEQIRGERIGTASDIYSLGVVLYELLTGRKPYKFDSKSQLDLEKAILEIDPPRPSSAVNSKPDPKSEIRNPKSLRGDLDNIVLKALRKEISERYVSVGQFSEDIRRYLEGVPIIARPHTFAYRAAKFFRRNRAGVVAAALVFLSLCAGIAVAFWQAREARRAELRAENRFREVRELANNVIFKYHDAIAELPGSTATREMLVRDATRYLDNLAAESSDNRALQRELARAYLKLGDVQGKAYAANIGDTAGALESYRKAVALLESVVAAETGNAEAKFELVRADDALFALLMRTSDMQEKSRVLERALGLQDELLAIAPDNPEYKLQKAQLLIRQGDLAPGYENKVEIFKNALALAENLFAADEKNVENLKLVMRINQRIGTALVWLGDQSAANQNPDAAGFFAAALPFHEKSYALAESLSALDRENLYNRRSLAAAATNLGETLSRNGRHREALDKIRIAERVFADTLAGDPRNTEAKFDVSTCSQSIAETLIALGETGPALDYLEKAYALNREIRQADPGNSEVRRALQTQSRQLAALCRARGDEKSAVYYEQEWKKIEESARERTLKNR